jgi:Ankyrin repeats (3 copies)
MLNFLGPGQHLFISAVSKAWKESYTRVDSAKVPELVFAYYDEAALLTITPKMTLYSAVYSAASRVNLAHECGLDFDNWKLQRIAGRAADISILQAAVEIGLQLTVEVLKGAAEATSVPKLQWLHIEQERPLPYNICDIAARCGSIDALRWLKDHGSAYTARTCEFAAAGAHLHVLQFLHDEGCEWHESACRAAAKHGHLPTLQWLHEQGCPWFEEDICDAAGSGSREMLIYLQQQGCEYDEDTLHAAALEGQLAICQYLVAEQCPSTCMACTAAAAEGHLEIVPFLRESGCPLNLDTITVGYIVF